MYKQLVYKKGHPLSTNILGRVRKSRFVLYEKLNGDPGLCHWCGELLTWKKLCADHLDSNPMNDVPENLVGSCRGCNANRSDGTGYGRRKKRECKFCHQFFLPKRTAAIFCSIFCSTRIRPKREVKLNHGSRSMYMRGCRCPLCKKSNTDYWRNWYHSSK